MDSTRDAAFKILLEMEKEGTYSNLAINNYLSSHQVESPGMLRKLVYGVTEKSLYLDYFLDKILTKGVKGTKLNVLTLLRMGAYQLEFMDSVPEYAAINTTVELARKYVRGMDKFVNGVLRSWQRVKPELSLPDSEENFTDYLSVRYSCHPSIVSLIISQYGEAEGEAILKDLEHPKPPAVRVNIMRNSPGEMLKELSSLGMECSIGDLSERVIILQDTKDLSITELDSFKEGRISIQSQESCWIADEANPKPGYKVLDLCAAPGGKTQAMAELMENRGSIDACDFYEHRLRLIEIGAKRLGLNNIDVHQVDSTGNLNMPHSGEYDLVLADVPCSGLGVMGKKPEIRNREINDEDLIKTQKLILENAINQAKPSGRIIYSTCTINKRENHEVVEAVLKDRKDIRVINERQLIPGTDNYDGFYMSVIEKIGE